ncbi:MAG: hypothetical protein IPP32_12335 [Bacteroidetes bacterium]|nr:hypothetical protein [Bacteroidota bacterium]
MNFSIESIVGILALLIAAAAFILQIRDSSKKKPPARFKGGIGKGSVDIDINTGNFVSFIFNKEAGEIIYLDIFFENDQNYGIDENNRFHFSFYEKPEPQWGGYSFYIEVNENDDFFFDNRPSSRRLAGHFKIIGTIGPQQGWVTAFLKPVKSEFIN